MMLASKRTLMSHIAWVIAAEVMSQRVISKVRAVTKRRWAEIRRQRKIDICPMPQQDE